MQSNIAGCRVYICFMRWSLEQLRTFVDVSKSGSMTRSAGSLGYTVAAVSHQIAGLENVVGKPLLIRSSRGTTLSDAGATLLPHAEALLEAEERAVRSVARNRTPDRIDVRVGVFGSIAVSALGRVTAELLRLAPHIRMNAIEVDVEVMPDCVLAGDVDIALGLSYPAAPHPPRRGLQMQVLAAERFQIVAPPSFIRRADARETLASANDSPWILPPPHSHFGRAMRDGCYRSGIQPIEEHLVTDTAVALALVEAGYGLTLATPLMMRLRPSNTQVLPLPIVATREIVALFHDRGRELDSVTCVLRALHHAFPGRTESEVATHQPNMPTS